MGFARTAPSDPPAAARRLYLFSPLPPQRNGLADYLLSYLPMLAAAYELRLVAESGTGDAVRQALAALLPDLPPITVLDEVEFLAHQPDSQAQYLYNIGNNSDCIYQLDYLHRFPGAVIVHDISLFYLHQITAQQAQAPEMMLPWLEEDGYRVPSDFVDHHGRLVNTPSLLYQECLMLGRLARSARGVMVHTAYAERRLRGSVSTPEDAVFSHKPLARIPHFVLPPPELSAEVEAEVLARFHVTPADFLILVPGFLSGNKMLFEIMAAFRGIQARCPAARLLFAGEERAQEYAVSPRLAQWWPDTGRPQVTGYLDSLALDGLLQRADLSLVLRFPSYGESSGILPRAAMGGGRVLTVDIGAYPEFSSPQVRTVPVGAGTVPALMAGMLDAYAAWLTDTPADRTARRTAEAKRLGRLGPAQLFGAMQTWLMQCAGERQA